MPLESDRAGTPQQWMERAPEALRAQAQEYPEALVHEGQEEAAGREPPPAPGPGEGEDPTVEEEVAEEPDG